MRLRSFSAVALLSFVAIISVTMAAQEDSVSKVAQRDPTALAVLQQSAATMGLANMGSGSGAAQAQTTFWDGRITQQAGVSLVDKSSVSALSAPAQSDAGAKPLPRWVTQYPANELLPGYSRMAALQEARTNVQYLGVEEVNGRKAHHIRLTALPSDNTPVEIEELVSEFHIFIDAETKLVIKTQSWDFSPDAIENRSKVETYYEEYRAVGGVLVPFASHRFVAGQKFCDTVLSDVRLDAVASGTETK